MIEKQETKDGLFYFIVKAKNGQIIANSSKYYTESARDNGIESLINIMMGIINNELKN